MASPSLPPPCTEHGKEIADLKKEQTVTSFEVKSLRDINHQEHKILRDDITEIKADVKNITRILTDPDTGFGGRLRRLEDTNLAIVESSKTTKTAIATTAAAFLALLGVIAQAVATFLSAAWPSSGPPSP